MLNKSSYCFFCLGIGSWGSRMWNLMATQESLHWSELCFHEARLFLLSLKSRKIKKGQLCLLLLAPTIPSIMKNTTQALYPWTLRRLRCSSIQQENLCARPCGKRRVGVQTCRPCPQGTQSKRMHISPQLQCKTRCRWPVRWPEQWAWAGRGVRLRADAAGRSQSSMPRIESEKLRWDSLRRTRKPEWRL